MEKLKYQDQALTYIPIWIGDKIIDYKVINTYSEKKPVMCVEEYEKLRLNLLTFDI